MNERTNEKKGSTAAAPLSPSLFLPISIPWLSSSLSLHYLFFGSNSPVQRMASGGGADRSTNDAEDGRTAKGRASERARACERPRRRPPPHRGRLSERTNGRAPLWRIDFTWQICGYISLLIHVTELFPKSPRSSKCTQDLCTARPVS